MEGFSKENQATNPKILVSIESYIKLYIEFININYTIIFKNFIYFYSLTMIIKGSYSFVLFTYIYKNYNRRIYLSYCI